MEKITISRREESKCSGVYGAGETQCCGTIRAIVRHKYPISGKMIAHPGSNTTEGVNHGF